MVMTNMLLRRIGSGSDTISPPPMNSLGGSRLSVQKLQERSTPFSEGFPIGFSKDRDSLRRLQLSLPGMSLTKQQKLFDSTCFIVLGGEPVDFALTHLAAAGIGNLIVFGDAGSHARVKASIASGQDANFCYVTGTAGSDLSDASLENVDMVIESSLDWQFKLHLSDLCMRLRLPLIHSGSSGMRFQIFSMMPGKSACLRCALPIAGIDDYPLVPVARDTFEPVAACAGALMALDAIKFLANIGVTQGSELRKVDGLSGEIEIIRGLDPRRDCPDCGSSYSR